MDEKLLAEVRFQFAQSVFNHSIQEMAASRKDRYAKYFVLVQLVLTSSVIIVLALQAAGVKELWINIVGIVSAAADLIFMITDLNFGYSKQAAQHRVAAQKFLSLRGQYLSLITDIMSGSRKKGTLSEKRDSLNEIYRFLSDSPNANSKDYVAAQKGLNTAGEENGEQFTWSDAEIDQFLPEQLRLKNRSKKRK